MNIKKFGWKVEEDDSCWWCRLNDLFWRQKAYMWASLEERWEVRNERMGETLSSLEEVTAGSQLECEDTVSTMKQIRAVTLWLSLCEGVSHSSGGRRETEFGEGLTRMTGELSCKWGIWKPKIEDRRYQAWKRKGKGTWGTLIIVKYRKEYSDKELNWIILCCIKGKIVPKSRQQRPRLHITPHKAEISNIARTEATDHWRWFHSHQISIWWGSHKNDFSLSTRINVRDSVLPSS